MKSWLDKLPPIVRHASLVFLAGALSVVAGIPVDGLNVDLVKTAISAGIGAVVAMLLAILTPLTRQYGVGSEKPLDR